MSKFHSYGFCILTTITYSIDFISTLSQPYNYFFKDRYRKNFKLVRVSN